MIDAESLGALVREHFTNHAASFALDPGNFEVEYVLNWGGFVNASYQIRGACYFHLKLSTSAEGQASLRRWMTHSSLLVPYHAPRISDWIDLGAAAGPLFGILPGHPPRLSQEVVDSFFPVLRRMYRDRALAAALQPADAATARDAYLASFDERFSEDLRGIRESPPPFVGEPLLAWMDEEASALRETIASHWAFDEPLTKAVHGDLWLNNVLWSNWNQWYIIDWDDMRIGDPAADVAAFLGPTAEDLRPLKMLDWAENVLTDLELLRLPALGRATLLDWVIDPLSDWVDAARAPAHQEEVRAEKQRVHQDALACYRRLYA